ncbi:MAG: FAD-binding oxidoreductase [Anaerolineales bacterium]|nr:FAD-binding oxidoreductase [Anaerolineales bacterium]
MTEGDVSPAWIEKPPPSRSYRSLFKWGDPAGYRHPNRGMLAVLKETLGMDDADFAQPRRTGFEPFDAAEKCGLDEAHLRALEAIAGAENVSTATYDRTRASYAGAAIDALRLRAHVVENLPDVVLAPRSAEEVRAVVEYCSRERIPLYVRGAGSGVTRGAEAVKGGVSLDMGRHMKRVVSFNETDQMITVEAGMTGPDLEAILNAAPERLGARRRYTCGHFPQSFLYSSVGGWVVTRGAGQNSTYYGKIEDIVLAQEYATPRGRLSTPGFPRCATGPNIDQILMGSEGCFGVLTAATLRVFRHAPRNTRRFSFLFPSWEEGLDAARESLQGEFGLPSVFRLSDPEETDVALRMYHIHGTPADSLLRALGYTPMRRCLMLGSADGDADYARTVKRKISALARSRGAFPLTLFGVTRRWEKTRFTDPYLREDLMDFGIMIDTLECAARWDQIPAVHAQVRAFVKSRPRTICMTHLSHAYPQGANLYFIFIARAADIGEYLKIQYGVLEAIRKSGAAMSHHHGIGKQTAPWLEEQIGTACLDAVRALKTHFDPGGVLNPGGTLGLDLSAEQREKRWGMRE